MWKCDQPQVNGGANLHLKGLKTQYAPVGGRYTLIYMIMRMMMIMVIMMVLMRTMRVMIR